MMHCEKVKELLEAYVEGELDESEQKALETHISGCESCKQELALTQSIPCLISSLSTPPAPEDIIPNALKRMHEEPAIQRRWLRGFSVFLSRKWQVVALGLALIVISLLAVNYHRTNKEPEITEVEVASAVDDLRLALGIVSTATQDIELTTLTTGAKALSVTKSKSRDTMRTLSNAQTEMIDKLMHNFAVLVQLQAKEAQKP